MFLPIKTAWEFVNKPGMRYRFGKQEEAPYEPEEKIYPFDAEKKVSAQLKANTELTGREVNEAASKGENPMGEWDFKVLKQIAKDNDVSIYHKKKADLQKELDGMGLLKKD